MKRKLLVIAAVLLMLAAVIVPAAAAPQKNVVTKKVYESGGGAIIGDVAGTIKYNTADGSWTFTQSTKVTLEGAGDQCTLGITSSRPVRGTVEGTTYSIALLLEQPDGTYSQSGVVEEPETIALINQCLADGGVFVIIPNG
jgi:hypothetical protein